MWLKRRANGGCENRSKTSYSIKSGGALTTDRDMDMGSGLLSDHAPEYLSRHTPKFFVTNCLRIENCIRVIHSNLVLKIGLQFVLSTRLLVRLGPHGRRFWPYDLPAFTADISIGSYSFFSTSSVSAFAGLRLK